VWLTREPLWEFNPWSPTLVATSQIGSETNWSATAFGGNANGLALKSDGTLWKWNPDYRQRANDDPGFALRQSMGKRFSEHDDWVAVAAWWEGNIALAADGNLWFWPTVAIPIMIDPFQIPALRAPSRRPQLLGNVFAAAGAPSEL
jgi:hypothetical protein